jgi:riboflavin synthase
MFTGLVQRVGTIRELVTRAQSKVLTIAATLDERDRALGASVSVSGVCLTVTRSDPGSFSAEAAFETLRATTLGALAVGDRVNLETALRVGDALGGHLVSGHVDKPGALRTRDARGDAVELWFDAPAELLPFIAVKGSICVDGVSLTVNEVDARGFSVGVIRHTIAVTTLGPLRVGARVNLEVDVLARYVARALACGGGSEPRAGVTREALAAAGYLSHAGKGAGR